MTSLPSSSAQKLSVIDMNDRLVAKLCEAHDKMEQTKKNRDIAVREAEKTSKHARNAEKIYLTAQQSLRSAEQTLVTWHGQMKSIPKPFKEIFPMKETNDADETKGEGEVDTEVQSITIPKNPTNSPRSSIKSPKKRSNSNVLLPNNHNDKQTKNKNNPNNNQHRQHVSVSQQSSTNSSLLGKIRNIFLKTKPVILT